jgi:hypothetical protein
MRETIRSDRVRWEVATAAPATVVALWGTLLVWITSLAGRAGSEPYSTGAVPPQAVVAFATVGLLAGLIAPSLTGLVGAALGFAAAIAIQLFVLTAQASWAPSVYSVIGRERWLVSMGTALIAFGAAIAVGFGVGWLARRELAGQPRAVPIGRPRALVVAAAILAGTVALVAVLLVDAGASTYLKPADEPAVAVTVGEDGSVALDSSTLPAGRATVVVPEASGGTAWLALTTPLVPAQLDALEAGRLTAPTLTTLAGSTRWQFEPGRHAIVNVGELEAAPPTWDGSYPVLGWALLTVQPASSPVPARGAGGPIPVVGFLAALAVNAVAVFMSGSYAIARRRADGTWPIGAPLALAAVTTLLVGGLAFLAVDLVHNPF